jgi:hypothetical protein
VFPKIDLQDDFMKLWENGNGVGLNEKVEEFTAGEDVRLDQRLVEWKSA